MEDKKITELFHNRAENAIDELMKKYGRLFKTLAMNILSNEEDAEECVNDACFEVWNAIPPANPDYLLSFSCKIVRRIAINRFRHNTRQKRNNDKTLPLEEFGEIFSNGDDMSKYVDSSHLHNVINDFLKNLDNESKAMFVRRYFFFESISDIAEVLGISENKISVRLYRIRKKLAEKLREEGVYEQ